MRAVDATRRLVYSMTVSLDGFVADPRGAIDWSAPDEELHRFHNDRVRETGAELCGRRLYEEMTFWDTVHEDPSAPEYILEFARIWQALPKIVFSTTLEQVQGNARLATRSVAEEVAELKAQPGKDLAVGGARLAATCIRLGLVDEFQLFISPIVLGAGISYFPALDERIELELLETRTFASRIVYVRYGRV
jgi:dihydrofolate reductase